MSQPIKIEPGTKVKLADLDPAYRSGIKDKEAAAAETQENVAALDDLSYRLYAEHQRALLLVLQGMDTSGKDGAIRKVLDGFNPQNCVVTPFKVPTHEEQDHDFLWRVHNKVPRRGHVGIFNRSHYEDVIVVRVHKLVPADRWKLRYDAINHFEQLLAQAGTTIIKIFLHISKDEQRRRLAERLADPSKRWKFNVGDLEERKLWDDYQKAYEDALTRCNTEHAPWHIVPANRKWHRDLALSRIVRETLEQMDPRYPPAPKDLDNVKIE